LSARLGAASLGNVGKFAWTDQAGRAVSADTLRGQVWAAAFFFTRCLPWCPRNHAPHADLQQAAAKGGVKLELVSFSVDPTTTRPRCCRLRQSSTRRPSDVALPDR